MIKVAVIGIGHLGYHHARILAKNSFSKLLYIVDIDEEKQKYSENFNARFFKHYQEVPEDIDAVFIATPTSTHAKIMEYFLNKGKHIFVEKTICDNLQSAYYLTNLAKKNNLILQIGYIEKFNPAVAYYKQNYFTPNYIESSRMHPFIKRCLDVDVILDLMIHDIDLLFYLYQPEIINIEAKGKKVLTNKLDEATAKIYFSPNISCVLKVSRVSSQAVREMKISQENKFCLLNFQEQSFSMGDKKISGEKIELLPLEIYNFIQWIKYGKGEIDNSAESTMPALELAFKIQSIVYRELDLRESR